MEQSDQTKPLTAQSMGRKGGQSRSKAKVESAQENGKRGGRPKKAIEPSNQP